MLKTYLFHFTGLIILSMFLINSDICAQTAESNSTAKTVTFRHSFDYDLFKEIIKNQPDKNIFISPLSVGLALAMTSNGAAGTTYEEMQGVLGFGNMSQKEINEYYKKLTAELPGTDPKVILQIANSIWYCLGLDFEESFLNTNQEYFQAKITGLNFSLPETPDQIDEWVNKNTMGKIKEIVTRPIDPSIVMYLINAVYFKGSWTNQFDKKQTQSSPFFTVGNTQTDCLLMYQKNKFKYFENEQFQIADIPYGQKDFVMTVILPNKNTAINQLIASLEPDSVDKWLSYMSLSEGHIYLPQFKMEYEINLNEILKNLGIVAAFGAADFSKIRHQKDLFISEVKHKTFIEVNEEGTEAAAATSVGIGITSVMEPRLFTLRCDRPFIYLIRERDSGTILFTGKLYNPKN